VNSHPPTQPGSTLVRLDPSTVERLALRTAELLADRLEKASTPAGQQLPDLLTAAEVSAWWGVHRGWVYEHASELGAIRIGSGQRPTLRFDAEQITRRLARPPVKPRT
jgi:hypothetical protein